MPWRRFTFRLIIALAAVVIAARAIVAVLPAPLLAEERRARIELYLSAVPAGMADILVPGEKIRHAESGSLFGTIVSVLDRPAGTDGETTASGWQEPRDILVRVSVVGRYHPGSGLFLNRNLPVRVGEKYPLRTTLGYFWGQVERIMLSADPVTEKD